MLLGNDEVKEELKRFLNDVEHHLQNCVENNGDYVEK